MGARTFFEAEKVGQELFLACEIGGLVVFFNRLIPQNPAWVPGKFWTVPKGKFKGKPWIFVRNSARFPGVPFWVTLLFHQS